MQISSNTLYDLTAKRMGALTGRATQLQTEISTGKRVQSPSDDPAVAQQLAELNRKDTDAGVYKQNMNLAASLLEQSDGVLGQISTQIVRARELVTKAANDTESVQGRKVIGAELQSIVDSIIGLANQRDVRGQPLFGTPDGVAAVMKNDDGTYSYAEITTTNPDGTTTSSPAKVSEVPIADGQTVQATESAARIFKRDGQVDTLKMLSDLATLLQTDAKDGSAARDALDGIQAAGDQVDVLQASVGARAARVELQQSLATTANADRTDLRSNLEDTDIASSMIELQKIMTALSATQASFSKLSSLSLFDYLR